MRKYFLDVFAVAVIVAFSSIETLAAEASIPAAPSMVEACFGGRKVCVTLSVARANGEVIKRGYRWGGEDMEPPYSMVSQLTVVAENEEVFIPLSAYADLGNPRTVEVKATGRGFDLVVNGGDASASYRALLIFERRSLARRRVQHNEFPDEAWEETFYRFNTRRK